MMEYPLPNGHKLYVGEIPNHGVVKAPFACRKVVLSQTEKSYFIEEWLPGFFTPDQCLEWLGVRPTTTKAHRWADPEGD